MIGEFLAIYNLRLHCRIGLRAITHTFHKHNSKILTNCVARFSYGRLNRITRLVETLLFRLTESVCDGPKSCCKIESAQYSDELIGSPASTREREREREREK